jgi:hypothetical protein
MNRIVINNHPHDPCSGGVKVLQYLTFLMESAGISVAGTNPCFFNPRVPVVDRCSPDDICVYPEVVEGNPLGANRIVRYLLYFPRYRVPASECPIVYMPEFMENCRAQCDGKILDDDIVEVPNIEAGDWCFPTAKSIENLLYTGKQNCKTLPNIPYVMMPNLSDPDRWKLRYESLALLRMAKNFYTMDHHTVMEHEAALCGCMVFKVFGENDFRQQFPNAMTRLMRPETDIALAVKFAGIVKKFFDL